MVTHLCHSFTGAFVEAGGLAGIAGAASGLLKYGGYISSIFSQSRIDVTRFAVVLIHYNYIQLTNFEIFSTSTFCLIIEKGEKREDLMPDPAVVARMWSQGPGN